MARFGRLQDTVADKLLLALLYLLAEPVGPTIDNLNKAERLGWIGPIDNWIGLRGLRIRMIPEYACDPAELAVALTAAHAAMLLLTDAVAMAARAMADQGNLERR